MIVLVILGTITGVAALILTISAFSDLFDDASPLLISLLYGFAFFCLLLGFLIYDSGSVQVEDLLNEYVTATSVEEKRDVIDDYFKDSKSTLKKQIIRDIDAMLTAKEGKVKSFEEIKWQDGAAILSCLDEKGNPVGDSIAVRYTYDTKLLDSSDITYYSLDIKNSLAQ